MLKAGFVGDLRSSAFQLAMITEPIWKLVQNLVEEHLIDVAARLQSFEAPEFSESSGSDSESETSMNSMPVSLAQQRMNALEMMGHDTGDNVLEVLRSLPNSGTVVVVWRWPCESVEILEEMQECLDNNQWEGADGTRRIQVMPIPCEPPSMIWTNFAAHLFERPGKEAAFFCSEKKLFLTGRQKQILVANVLIVSAFVIMLVFYYFLYKMVYGKGRHPEQILTTIVTCCCAVGNVLLNQLVVVCFSTSWISCQNALRRLCFDLVCSGGIYQHGI